ncbi:hypothetical protein [Arthrobacter sp. MA-N2]|uniref:hypothetical protein n=1 Tax=Arthrobacter sp. MA-N2 TaxID=1101188 RepID=UPI0004B66DD6|nr:hypothetical protein [Arthrobacter sp. MA-N2]
MPDDLTVRTRDTLVLSLDETLIRVRFGHLLLRTVGEWDELSAALTRAYEDEDDHLIERLSGPLLQSWRGVPAEVLANTFNRARITVTRASHPWGIAVFSVPGLKCEPLLCSVEDSEAGSEVHVADRPRLLDFDSVMASYAQCLERLLSPTREGSRVLVPCSSVSTTNPGGAQAS